MKIFFFSSPKFVNSNRERIKKIFNTLVDLGHTHLNDFVLKVAVDEFYATRTEDISKFNSSLVKDIKKADLCVFETTEKTLGVGHLINQALIFGKPVIALYTDSAPMALEGGSDGRLQLVQYEDDLIEPILRETIEFAKGQSDTRFNFFISPRHSNYLDWISKNKKLPRSVFLRNLIKEDMKNYPEFMES